MWKRIRDITLKEDSLRDEALVRASPVYKCLVDIKHLTKPIVASRGINEVIERVGALKLKDLPSRIDKLSHKSPHYKVSGIRALEIIQANPDWLRGDIRLRRGPLHFSCARYRLGGCYDRPLAVPIGSPNRVRSFTAWHWRRVPDPT